MTTPALTTLRRRNDFVRIYQQGKSVATKGLILQRLEELPADAPAPFCVGITATSKLGGAVIRNRIKRRFRALTREILSKEARSGWYVVVGRKASLDRPYDALIKDLRYALHQLNAYQRQPRESR